MNETSIEQVEQLEKNGYYLSVPRGVSMWPMILNKESIVEIHRLDGPAKRYDLVMYVRGEKQGVIHRVIRVYDDRYYILGDNCWSREFVNKQNVKGIVTRFYRKGKWYDVDDKWYKLYVHIWVDFLFIKRPLFYVRDKFKALIRKISKHTTETK